MPGERGLGEGEGDDDRRVLLRHPIERRAARHREVARASEAGYAEARAPRRRRRRRTRRRRSSAAGRRTVKRRTSSTAPTGSTTSVSHTHAAFCGGAPRSSVTTPTTTAPPAQRPQRSGRERQDRRCRAGGSPGRRLRCRAGSTARSSTRARPGSVHRLALAEPRPVAAPRAPREQRQCEQPPGQQPGRGHDEVGDIHGPEGRGARGSAGTGIVESPRMPSDA